MSTASLPNDVILNGDGPASGGHPGANLPSDKAFNRLDTSTSYRVGLVRSLYSEGSRGHSASNRSRAAPTAFGSSGSAAGSTTARSGSAPGSGAGSSSKVRT